MSRRTRERGWPPDPQPLPAPVVDNHTHLESVLGFAPDDADTWGPGRPTLAAHLERAAQAGVPRLVQVGCDLDAAAWTDRVLREHAGDRTMLGALAVHPNEAVLHAGVREVAPDGLDPVVEPRHETGLDEALATVAGLARGNDRVRAIGETGLDHFRAGTRGREVQVEAFRAHIALAKELGLALQIHDRDAHAQVIEVLERDGAPERTVFHCFSGDAAMARLCVERGWYLSFAGPLTFRANDELRQAARETPVSRLLVETDAPYLTPHPYRGRPNAPYLLPLTVRGLAETRGIELAGDAGTAALARLCDDLSATAEQVYGSW